MALYTVLALAAGFALNGGQEPGVDTQIVAPVMNDSAATSPITPAMRERIATASPQAAQAATQSRVSVQFNDAKPSEVFGALKNLGIDFVVSADEVPANARITLNVKDQPVGDVLNAVAKALGGHWERENNIRVFKKGVSVYPSIGSNGFGQEFPTPPAFKSMPPMPPMPPMPAMPSMPSFKANGKMSQQEMEKAFGPEFQKKMEAWGKEFEKNFGPEYQKRMEDWAKNFESGKFDDAKVFRLKMMEDGKPDPAEIEKLRKSGIELRIQGDKLRKEGETLRLNGDKIRKELELRVKSSKDGNDVFVWGTPGRITPRAGFSGLPANLDVEKFIKDLTPNQKDMQRKRGYIRYSDLTPTQKKTLGDRPDGKFEITFKVNGDQITIRND